MRGEKGMAGTSVHQAAEPWSRSHRESSKVGRSKPQTSHRMGQDAVGLLATWVRKSRQRHPMDDSMAHPTLRQDLLAHLTGPAVVVAGRSTVSRRRRLPQADLANHISHHLILQSPRPRHVDPDHEDLHKRIAVALDRHLIAS